MQQPSQPPEEIARRFAGVLKPEVEPDRLIDVISRVDELDVEVRVQARGFTIRCQPRKEDGDDVAAGKLADLLEQILASYLDDLRNRGLGVNAEREWTEENPKVTI